MHSLFRAVGKGAVTWAETVVVVVVVVVVVLTLKPVLISLSSRSTSPYNSNPTLTRGRLLWSQDKSPCKGCTEK